MTHICSMAVSRNKFWSEPHAEKQLSVPGLARAVTKSAVAKLGGPGFCTVTGQVHAKSMRMRQERRPLQDNTTERTSTHDHVASLITTVGMFALMHHNPTRYLLTTTTMGIKQAPP